MSDPSNHYSDKGFWKKLKGVTKLAGREVLEKALWLYCALQRNDMSATAKATVIGALGYFIFPFDVIPDIFVPLGYTDDLGLLIAAVKTVSEYIGPEEKRQANEKLDDLGF